MRKLISDTFDFVDDISCAHHSYYHCLEQNCQSVSNSDASLFHGKKDKFQHKWLSDKELTYCHQTGFFWLLYAEGKGMYCILCSKHKTRNKQNQADIFTGKPGTRYKKSALKSHADSDRHKAAIEAELLQKNSQFAKDVADRAAKGDKTMFSAFMSAYWLAKHEVANSKLLSLLKLLETSGVEHMKYFSYKGEETLRDIFLTIGEVIQDTIIQQATQAGCYGILMDEVSDISVLELLVTFIQYVHDGEVKTNFLFVEDLLKASSSADANTIYTVATTKLLSLKLELNKLASIVTDGASVMTGHKSGVAALLKERVNKSLINVHCLAHRLALSCTDTAKDIKYITTVQNWMKQLWKYFENSPKRTALYLKVQIEVKKLSVPDKVSKKAHKKLKKACSTRWLSFDASTQPVYADYVAILITLSELSASDATAKGLLHEIRTTKFLGTVYILKEVLPELSKLSKTFQYSNTNFSTVQSSVDYTIDRLKKIKNEMTPLKNVKADLDPVNGRLQLISAVQQDTSNQPNTCDDSAKPSVIQKSSELRPLEMNQGTEKQLSDLLSKYITCLVSNINDRFQESLPVVSAFQVFDPLLVPDVGGVGFSDYGEIDVKTMADHFYSESAVKATQLKDEWRKFKYDLANWKKKVPEELKPKKKTAHAQSTSCTEGTTATSGMQQQKEQAKKKPEVKKRQQSSTEWCMQRLITLKQGLQFELLPQIAEIASSLPMSNVWPERGASCLKRLKTRLRSRINVDMLNTLMLISINGPDLYSPECNELIESAVLLWNNKKNRRKLPPKVPVETESTVFVAVPHSVDSACQTEACETESTLEDSFLNQQSISDESDVILALGLSREESECDSDFYSDSEFD